jgi:uncharacterized RDD family membrane protein YckC
MAKPVVRVLFARRLGAFAIDVLLIGIALTFVHNALTFFVAPLMGGAAPMVGDDSMWGLVPWGFHPTVPIALQALIAVTSAVVVLGYFTWFEGHEGRSLGKRALELRVVRIDGHPMTYREALLRNLVKLSPPILLLDTILMLLAFREDKQRVSDRIAGTIVVRA